MAGSTVPRWPPRPFRPKLRANSGLFSSLTFAAATGAERGFANVADLAAVNTAVEGGQVLAGVTPGRGFWETTVDTDNYRDEIVGVAEKCAADGESVRFANQVGMPSPRVSYEVVFGWSIAVLCRPYTVGSSTGQMIFQRRISPFGAANSGWSLGSNAAGGYDVSFSDGAAEARASSTTTQVVGRMDLVVATYDRTTLRLFVNGQREAALATALVVGNPNRSIRLFGSTPFWHGSVALAAAWNRDLKQGEVNRLYADPWTLFREEEEDVGELAAAFQSYMLVF